MTCPNSARRRFKQVSFRVTQEQADAIDRMVALSGMAKQDYIVARLLDEEVTVVPSTRVIKALRDHCLLIVRELRSLDWTPENNLQAARTVLADMNRLVAVMEGFSGESVTQEDPIRALKRSE